MNFYPKSYKKHLLNSCFANFDISVFLKCGSKVFENIAISTSV